MFITWEQDTTPEYRLAQYERKKALLRARTAGWPVLPPEDMGALPKPVQRLWADLAVLRREHARQAFGMSFVNLYPHQRKAMHYMIHNVVPIVKRMK